MVTILLLSLLASPVQGAPLTQASPKSPLLGTSSDMSVDATPDVVLRGRSTKIVITGHDLKSLKTLQVSPPDGVTLGAITPLPARVHGAAVSVDVTVDANAEPGERALLLTVTPEIATAGGTRLGGDSLSQAMQAARAQIARDQAGPTEVGSLFINSHELAVTAVTIGKGDPREVRVSVTDPQGDIESPKPRGTSVPTSGGLTVLAASTDLIFSEAHCGPDIFEGFLDDPKVLEQQGAQTVLGATFMTESLEGTGSCELWVRVRDRAGNISRWFTTKLSAR